MNESMIVNQIMRVLAKHGQVFRTNSGTVKTATGHTFHGLPKGFSDLMFVGPGGVAAFVEVKAPGGKASPEQLRFLGKMQGLGCRAGIAYSVLDACQICGIEPEKPP